MYQTAEYVASCRAAYYSGYGEIMEVVLEVATEGQEVAWGEPKDNLNGAKKRQAPDAY